MVQWEWRGGGAHISFGLVTCNNYLFRERKLYLNSFPEYYHKAEQNAPFELLLLVKREHRGRKSCLTMNSFYETSLCHIVEIYCVWSKNNHPSLCIIWAEREKGGWDMQQRIDINIWMAACFIHYQTRGEAWRVLVLLVEKGGDFITHRWGCWKR